MTQVDLFQERVRYGKVSGRSRESLTIRYGSLPGEVEVCRGAAAPEERPPIGTPARLVWDDGLGLWRCVL